MIRSAQEMGSLRSGGTSGVFGRLVPIMYAACPLSWNAISRTADMSIVRTGRIVRLNRLPIDPELTKSLRFIDGRFTKRPQSYRLLRKSGVCIMNILGGRPPRESARGRMRLSTVRAISMLGVVGVVGVVGVLGGGQAIATQGNSDNISFCHRTDSVTNPYEEITTDPASIIQQGHDGHDGSIFDGTKDKTKWGDIIPAFWYPEFGNTPAGHFDGLNVKAVDVPAGEAWLGRHCEPAPELTKTHLTLVKVVVNTGGGKAHASDWTLKADGKTDLSGKTGDEAVTNASVEPGTYTLKETGGPDGYEASPWSCKDTKVTNDGAVALAATAGAVTLAEGDSVTCTITNTFKHHDTDLRAHLTLVKVVVNAGGGEADASDWTLKADGPTDLSGVTKTAAVTNASVEPGTYTLKESDGPDGYEASQWSCKDTTVTKDEVVKVTEGDHVSLAADDSVTCTITNTFKHHDTDKHAHLTLVKNVVNNGVGTALATDWTLKAVGPDTISGATGSHAVKDAEVTAGDFTLSESGGPSGYTGSAWSCSNKTVTAGVVKLTKDDSVTCTITNTFQGRHVDNSTHLTLVKNVVNDGGGTALATDWTLNAVGPVTISGTSGSSKVNGALVQPGDFTLSESGGPSGYTASAWSCPNKTVTDKGAVTLAAGDSVTCTITNTFLPAHLTLIKKVVNGHGGTALATRWTLKAAGSVTISGISGSTAVTGAAVPAGDFKLSESGGPSGYTASAWLCPDKKVTAGAVSLAAGESVTCTITNTQKAPAALQVLGVSETAPAVAGAPKSLAFTGPAEILPLGLAGLFALALGGVLTAVSRRRVRS
jgi:hypothetical protein